MRTLIYALAFATALGGSAAMAQESQGPSGPMMGPRMMMGPMMGMGPMMDPSQHIEGRLAFLKTELKITDAQMPQWTKFADAFRANAQRMGELHKTMATTMGPGRMMGQDSMSGQAGVPLPWPDRLDRIEKALTAHLDLVRAIKGPATELYAVLSDDQKRTADTLLRGPMGMM